MTLLALAVIVLSIYSTFTVYTRHITVSKPSLATFEKLHSAYAETLKCPCSKISIPHGNMTTLLSMEFHPVSTILLVSSDCIILRLATLNLVMYFLLSHTSYLLSLMSCLTEKDMLRAMICKSTRNS
jgi:hypothetical protein